MKKLIRRILASVLTVCTLLGMLPALAAEAPDPFALKGVESVTYTSGSHSLIVTDDATVKKVPSMSKKEAQALLAYTKIKSCG